MVDAELSVYDLTGRLLLRRLLTTPAGVVSIRLPGRADVPTGTYVLCLRAGGEVRQVRVQREELPLKRLRRR